MGFFKNLFKKNKDKSVYTPPVTSATGKIELDIPEELFKDEYRKSSGKSNEAKRNNTKVKKAKESPTKTVSAKTNKKKANTSIEKTTITKTEKAASQKKGFPSPKRNISAKATDKPEQKPESDKNSSAGYFEIKGTKDDRYVFNLYAANHLIIATSQVYSSPQGALTGIKSVRTNYNVPIEDQTLKSHKELPYPKWEIYLDSANEYRFRLSASNGYTVCHSQGYNQKSSCKNGIKSIQKFAPTARIEKEYLKKDS